MPRDRVIKHGLGNRKNFRLRFETSYAIIIYNMIYTYEHFKLLP